MAFQYQGGYQGNPQGATNFAVQPGNNMLPGLQGIGQAMGVMGAQQKEKKAKAKAEAAYTDIRTRLAETHGLPDYERAQEVAKLQGDYPEVMSKWGDALVGYDETARNLGPRKQIVGQTLQAIAQNPDNALPLLQDAKMRLNQAGVMDTPRLDSMMQRVAADPGYAKDNALTEMQLYAPDRAAAFKSAQPARDKPTTLMQNLVAAGFTPGTPEYRAQMLKAMNKPTGTTINMGDAKTMEKATGAQLSSSGFARKVVDSNNATERLELGGYDPTSSADRAKQGLPGGNYWLSDEAQAYNGAKEAFILAVLRDESGASIGSDEFMRAEKLYFPMPGDSSDTVKTKRERRSRQAEVLKAQTKGVYGIQWGSGDEIVPTGKIGTREDGTRVEEMSDGSNRPIQ